MKLYAYHRRYENETGASMHLALQEGEALTPLHNGFGILFPKCVFDDTSLDGSSRGLRQPWLFRMGDGFGIAALRCTFNSQGVAHRNDGVVFFTSGDLLSYEERGLLPLAQADAATDIRCTAKGGQYWLHLLVDGAGKPAISSASRPAKGNPSPTGHPALCGTLPLPACWTSAKRKLLHCAAGSFPRPCRRTRCAIPSR